MADEDPAEQAEVAQDAAKVHAVLPVELCDELAALATEAEARVRSLAVRCYRALSRVEVAVIDNRLDDEALELVRRVSGYSRLSDLLSAMVDELEVARLDRPGSLPDWAERERAELGLAPIYRPPAKPAVRSAPPEA